MRARFSEKELRCLTMEDLLTRLRNAGARPSIYSRGARFWRAHINTASHDGITPLSALCGAVRLWRRRGFRLEGAAALGAPKATREASSVNRTKRKSAGPVLFVRMGPRLLLGLEALREARELAAGRRLTRSALVRDLIWRAVRRFEEKT